MKFDKIDNEVLTKQSIKKGIFSVVAALKAVSKEKMAYYAFKNTRFYKDLYAPLEARGINIRTANFESLPLVEKKRVNSYLPFDMLAAPMESKVFKYGETTGSTGSPTPSFYTKQEFYGSVLLAKLTPLSTILRPLIKENRRAVCGLACGFTIAGASFHQILDQFGFLTINVDARTTISPPHRVARLLSRYKPSVIVASESDFLAWMKVLKEEHLASYKSVVENLKVLISTAELCSESRSRQIEEQFNIIHIDNYACVEGYFSMPCPCGEKHILPVYHTEVFNDDFSDTSEYGTGRFAFTNLFRKSTPFVRYLLDDLVTIYKSGCPFGYKKSIRPHGRYELTVKIGDDRYGNRHFENVLFENYLFGEYNVEVHPGKLVIKAEDYQQGRIPRQRIVNDFERTFGLRTELKILSYGALRDYRDIRKAKPLLRLLDKRNVSTQKIPKYI